MKTKFFFTAAVIVMFTYVHSTAQNVVSTNSNAISVANAFTSALNVVSQTMIGNKNLTTPMVTTPQFSSKPLYTSTNTSMGCNSCGRCDHDNNVACSNNGSGQDCHKCSCGDNGNHYGWYKDHHGNGHSKKTKSKHDDD